jgi:hypothetical protein
VLDRTAPPRPRRGREPCASSRVGEEGGHRVLGCPERAGPPAVNPLALARTDRGRRARRCPWRRAGLRRDPRCDVPSRPALHLLVAALCARRLGYIVAPTNRSSPHWKMGAITNAAPPSPRRRQFRPHRDGHQLPSLRPSSPATQGSSK